MPIVLTPARHYSLTHSTDVRGLCTSSVFPSSLFFDRTTLLTSMQKDRIRPDPVSCQSCRSRNLKCSRVQPCSNCTARGITCKFVVRPQGQTDNTILFHRHAEILKRIDRLESIVLKKTGSAEPCSSDDRDFTGQQPPYANSESTFVYNVHRQPDQDSRLLESVGTRDDSLVRGHHLNANQVRFSMLILSMMDSFLACRMA